MFLNPDPWGFMISFDEHFCRYLFKHQLDKPNHQLDKPNHQLDKPCFVGFGFQ